MKDDLTNHGTFCEAEGKTGKKVKDIEMDLITIPCTWNLLNSIQDTEHYKNHMNTIMGITHSSLEPT